MPCQYGSPCREATRLEQLATPDFRYGYAVRGTALLNQSRFPSLPLYNRLVLKASRTSIFLRLVMPSSSLQREPLILYQSDEHERRAHYGPPPYIQRYGQQILNQGRPMTSSTQAVRFKPNERAPQTLSTASRGRYRIVKTAPSEDYLTQQEEGNKRQAAIVEKARAKADREQAKRQFVEGCETRVNPNSTPASRWDNGRMHSQFRRPLDDGGASYRAGPPVADPQRPWDSRNLV